MAGTSGRCYHGQGVRAGRSSIRITGRAGTRTHLRSGRSHRLERVAAPHRSGGESGSESGSETHGQSLKDLVRGAVERYFDDLGDAPLSGAPLPGAPVTGLYDFVLEQVEEPLLQTVMERHGGNQTRAAEVLGMSRGTLRKKLIRYGLL